MGRIEGFTDRRLYRNSFISNSLWCPELARAGAAVEQLNPDIKQISVRVVIDADGFRPNVGIILCNDQNRLFWGRRVGQNAWQFPQGGIHSDETPEQAMFRELQEEVGLLPEHVDLLGSTSRWLRYRLPKRFIRRHSHPVCIGQKQRWFLLRVHCRESDFCLDSSEKPEFDSWRWVKYWQPVREVIYFKRRVYERALEELAPLLFPDGAPARPHTNYLRQHRR